jgi:hypothetical protein
MVGNCGETPGKVTDKLLVVYPNPANNFVNLNSFKDFKEVEIYNTLGNRCFQQTLFSKEAIQINVSSFQAGMYFVRVHFTDGNTASEKFIIQ